MVVAATEVNRMTSIPEFLRPSEAMALLGIRHPDTLRKLRRAHPEIAVRFLWMKHTRYRKDRLLALLEQRHPPGGLAKAAGSGMTPLESAVPPAARST